MKADWRSNFHLTLTLTNPLSGVGYEPANDAFLNKGISIYNFLCKAACTRNSRYITIVYKPLLFLKSFIKTTHNVYVTYRSSTSNVNKMQLILKGLHTFYAFKSQGRCFYSILIGLIFYKVLIFITDSITINWRQGRLQGMTRQWGQLLYLRI